MALGVLTFSCNGVRLLTALLEDNQAINMISILVLCFAGTLMNYALGNECNYTALAQCWAPLAGLVDPHQLLFPVFNDGALEQFCRQCKNPVKVPTRAGETPISGFQRPYEPNGLGGAAKSNHV
ncbi:hypothetical protein CAPTEDRAFT_197298 [Capitella teleta]|uniref:Uncharacterized protein n=1 Tax=Capitella teleta TaxID=283909 RepID=R7TND0_CAPTE|nr:hypothetical protein CAPTEDRAFT_197298 [Capitella teleta]|eukprot:ELT95348.1 hypothetical protein CAPTEDRAFT_197298 [Capitella teleta]